MQRLATVLGLGMGAILAGLLALLMVIALLRDTDLPPALPDDPEVELGRTADVALLFDPAAKLDSDQIRSIQARLQPSEGRVPGYGLRYFEGGRIWLGFVVPPLPSAEARIVIRIRDTRVRQAQLAVTGAGGLKTFDWRYDDPTRRAGLSNRVPTFAFDKAEIVGRTVLVGFNSLGALRGNVVLMTERAAAAEDNRQGFTYGLFAGTLAALALYLLVIGWRMAEPSLVFTAGLLFFAGWFILGFGGYVHAAILPGHPNLADVLLYGTQPVVMTFWLLLGVSYLGVLKRHPRLGFLAVLVAMLLPLQGILTLLTALGFPLPFLTDNATPVLIALVGGFGIVVFYAIGGDWRAIRLLACFLPVLLFSLARVAIYRIPSPDAALAAIFESYADVPLTMALLALLVSLDLQVRERGLRRRAEDNETRFRLYAEIATDSYFETDGEGRLLRAAGSVALAYGFAPGLQLQALLPSLPSVAVLNADAGIRDFEVSQADLGGRQRWLAVNLFPLADGEEAAGWRGTLRDVTERVEARRQESRQSTLLALGQLASGVAHEVNNLLHPMINLAQRVRDRHTDDDEARRLLDLVVTSGRHAGDIVAGVLRSFNPTRIPGRNIAMGAAVEEALAAIAPTLPASVVLHREIDPAIAIPVGSGEMLQVLSNLAANAVRATEGRGRIVVRLAGVDGGGAELAFEDDGPGVPEALRSSLTEPFVSGRADGTGLGLAIVAGIVRNWGGTLQITQAFPRGARFVITLSTAGISDRTIPEDREVMP